MSAKYLKIGSFVVLFLLVINTKIYCQEEMDFEEFMGMMSETMTDQQLDELSDQLPWNIRVCAYAYGDFSGHGLNDIAISIIDKDSTPAGTVDVYFFENIGDTTYYLVDQENYKYYEIPLEVAFLVKNGTCFVTYRDQGNWYFTGYQINDVDSNGDPIITPDPYSTAPVDDDITSQLVQVSNEVYPIDLGKAGN